MSNPFRCVLATATQKHGNGDFLVQWGLLGKVSLRGILESIRTEGKPLNKVLLEVLTLGVNLEMQIQAMVSSITECYIPAPHTIYSGPHEESTGTDVICV